MKIKATYLNSLYCLGVLIPGRAAEELHLSRVFIYAGHNSPVDSCLVLTVGIWSYSSLLLRGAIKCCEVDWCFFLLSPQGDTVDLFPASSCEALMLAQVSSVLPAQMSVRGTTSPCQVRFSTTSFWQLLKLLKEKSEIFLVRVPRPKLVQVTWDFFEATI